MYAQVLDVTEYEQDGWTWRATTIAHPTWAQIDEAILRLDKFHFPFFNLWPDVDPRRHELVPEVEALTLLGGAGDYWIAITAAGYFQRRYVDPSGDARLVELWTSDQGFSDEARFVCRDLGIVRRIVRYYAETGGFDPGASWEA
jgi:hypothetical protein